MPANEIVPCVAKCALVVPYAELALPLAGKAVALEQIVANLAVTAGQIHIADIAARIAGDIALGVY